MQLYVGGIERMLYGWSGGNVMHLYDVSGMEVVYYVVVGALYMEAMCGKIMDCIENLAQQGWYKCPCTQSKECNIVCTFGYVCEVGE